MTRRRAAPPDAALHVTATPPRPDLTRGRRDDPRPRDYHRSRDRGIRTWVYADPGSAGNEAPVRCELDRSALRVRRGGAHALLAGGVEPGCRSRHPVRWPGGRGPGPHEGAHRRAGRSEEHTSELQSLMRISYAVFCL